MNQAYEHIQHDADHLYHRTEQMVDDHEHPMAESVCEQAKAVRETIERGRPPRSVEDAIRHCQQSLDRLKAQPNPAMSPQDAGQLLRDYEDLRRKVRELPNY